MKTPNTNTRLQTLRAERYNRVQANWNARRKAEQYNAWKEATGLFFIGILGYITTVLIFAAF